MTNILIVEKEDAAADFLESNLQHLFYVENLPPVSVERVRDPEEAITLLSANHSSPMISSGKVTRTGNYDLVITSSFYEVIKSKESNENESKKPFEDIWRGLDLWKGAPRRYTRRFMFHTSIPNDQVQSLIQKTHNTYIPVIGKYNEKQLDDALIKYFRL